MRNENPASPYAMRQLSEEQRLEILASYKVMDSASEEMFDELTRVTATICQAPISLICLVDRERAWFKSKVGIESTETPRDLAFCDHAIRQSEILEVQDTLEDSRFVGNPLVTGALHIRFYAGAPLITTEGANLGTLCVIDREPRKLTAAQKKSLEALRNMVVRQLEYRRALGGLRKLQEIVPMCAWCGSIRREDETGQEAAAWQPLQEYIASIASVSHGICPSCSKTVSKEPESEMSREKS